MSFLEIGVIIFCVVFVSAVIGCYIYKKIKHLPTGECASCKKNKSSFVDEYHKKYGCSNCKK